MQILSCLTGRGRGALRFLRPEFVDSHPFVHVLVAGNRSVARNTVSDRRTDQGGRNAGAE